MAKTRQTRGNFTVIHDSAVGTDAASSAAARVFTSEVVASAVRRAVVVGLAFSCTRGYHVVIYLEHMRITWYPRCLNTSVARDQRVTDIARGASANGSVVAAAVKSGLASRVGAARAGLAQILLHKQNRVSSG